MDELKIVFYQHIHFMPIFFFDVLHSIMIIPIIMYINMISFNHKERTLLLTEAVFS